MSQQFNKKSGTNKQQRVGVDSVQRSNTPFYIIGGLLIGAAIIGAVVWAVSRDNQTDTASTDILEFQPVTVTGNALPAIPETGADPAIGQPAPELKGATFDGTPVNIAKDGRAKAISFVAHWCPHCRTELPKVSSYIKDNKDKFPIEYFAVATGTSPTRANYPPSAWFSSVGFPSPVLADDRTFPAGKAFGLSSYPYFVFLDANNNVVARTSGEIEPSELENYVKAATGQGPVPSTTAPPATTPAG